MMYGIFRSSLEKFLGLMGLGLVRKSDLQRLRQVDVSQESNEVDFEMIQLLHQNVRFDYAKSREGSTSALRQDLFALLVSSFKPSGFFVEFGACDGKFVSNSYLLESQFNWDGILCEPARIWHKQLSQNRSANVARFIVWSESGRLIQFNEYVSPGLSKAGAIGKNSVKARIKKSYKVESITLLDLLESYKAPNEIDFISIDTEGSEYEILKDFDFTKFKISAFAIEHNFDVSEKLVCDLLTKNGYSKVLSGISRYEGWYVHQSKLREFSSNFINSIID